ncbi:MAG: class I SAM-dependent methyltransferase [bacterium]
MIKQLANGWVKNSFANRLRQRRMSLLLDMLSSTRPPISVLDVGGQEEFWKALDMSHWPQLHITLLNLFPINTNLPFVSSCVGDARSMTMFADHQFDIVFSNSVIEHVGGLRDQKAMAQECLRIGNNYFVQTPNRYFPLEPHFLFPGFQFLPNTLRAFLHSRFNLGWWKRRSNFYAALEEVESIRLLTYRELLYIFPGCNIWREKVWGITKSYVVYSQKANHRLLRTPLRAAAEP